MNINKPIVRKVEMFTLNKELRERFQAYLDTFNHLSKGSIIRISLVAYLDRMEKAKKS